jgi:very-short-patch-repair endonuclease
MAKRQKHTIEEIRDIFKSNDCQLISQNYLSCKEKLEYRCVCGNVSRIRLDNFKSGQRCKECAKNNLLVSYDYLVGFFLLNGCILTTERNKYMGAKYDLSFICKCGKTSNKNFQYFKANPYCSECGRNIGNEKKRFKQEDVEKIFEDNGCVLISSYNNYDMKMEYVCSCGEKSKISLGRLLRGQRCVGCGREKFRKKLSEDGKVPCSAQQRYIYDLVGGKLNYNIGRYVVDIALPDNNICIEYNGGGHRLSVLFGTMTNSEFDSREFKRKEYIKNKGWKIIIIESPTDNMPIDLDIMFLIDTAVLYLNKAENT